MKVVLYIATSLDGYIARSDGSVDWLDVYSEEEMQDVGYDKFYKRIGTVIMGNKTYKQVLGFGEYPYKDVESFVLTKNKKKHQTKDKHVTFISQHIPSFVKAIKDTKGKKDIWLIGGAEIIDEFLKHNLIDEYIITIVPTLLGKGIPLFRPSKKQHNLQFVSTRSFKSGLVEVKYERKKE